MISQSGLDVYEYLELVNGISSKLTKDDESLVTKLETLDELIDGNEEYWEEEEVSS